MPTLDELRSEVYKAIGNRSGTDEQVWAARGINVGILAFALLTEPPECRTSGYGNAVLAGTVININTQLTRPIRLERVYNVTRSCPVLEVPFRMWDLLWLPTTGYVTYFTLHGYNMYYAPFPTGTEQLQMWYFQYPARLDDGADEYPFKGGEDFVLSFAKRWAWAQLEEKEDSEMWSTIANDLVLPEKLVSDLRKYTREEWGYESNVQRALQPGAAQG